LAKFQIEIGVFGKKVECQNCIRTPGKLGINIFFKKKCFVRNNIRKREFACATFTGCESEKARKMMNE
jgi:hypothetical protein